MAVTFFSQGIISARNNHHRNQILVYFDIHWDSPKIMEASAVDAAISVPILQVHNQVEMLFPKTQKQEKAHHASFLCKNDGAEQYDYHLRCHQQGYHKCD